MMRRDEIDSAHIVHKGGAYPTPSVIHTNVSLIKYTANPARKTRREWQTMCITTIPISAMANPVSDVRFWFCWLWFWLTLTQWHFFEKYVWFIVLELLLWKNVVVQVACFQVHQNTKSCQFEVEMILKGSLDWISSPSLKILIMAGKVAWGVKAKYCWALSTNLRKQKVIPANNLNYHWRW